MVDQDDGATAESRPPTLNDLLTRCRELNERKAKYVVIGGMAMIQPGFVRGTEEVDLLIEASPENQAAVLKSLEIPPDKAVSELREGDLERFVVVRVADEIVVDLMLSAGGIRFAQGHSRRWLLSIWPASQSRSLPPPPARANETDRQAEGYARSPLLARTTLPIPA